jgi:hypothetical protein
VEGRHIPWLRAALADASQGRRRLSDRLPFHDSMRLARPGSGGVLFLDLTVLEA